MQNLIYITFAFANGTVSGGNKFLYSLGVRNQAFLDKRLYKDLQTKALKKPSTTYKNGLQPQKTYKMSDKRKPILTRGNKSFGGNLLLTFQSQLLVSQCAQFLNYSAWCEWSSAPSKLQCLLIFYFITIIVVILFCRSYWPFNNKVLEPLVSLEPEIWVSCIKNSLRFLAMQWL